ncbi:hypothetical protein DV735_g588, partial [Chaetothyriales sp. CBS 134920]
MQRETARCLRRIGLQHHCHLLQPAQRARWPRPPTLLSYRHTSSGTASATESSASPASAAPSYGAPLSSPPPPSAPPAAIHDHNQAVNTLDVAVERADLAITANAKQAALPVTCPGCGALSSDTDPSLPGYYTRTRKSVRFWFRAAKRQALGDLDTGDSAGNASKAKIDDSGPDRAVPPVCDRCHELLHNHHGTSIAHPRIEDIADSIAESPHSRNHVYHVLDAADFPMSLLPSIIARLSLAKPRTQNRRSTPRWTTQPTLSFIITRSDLLGPTKEKVDALMPYFRDTLRSALYSADQSMRLGNVHLVSAKRGWWAKEIKDAIWERGGANWMVGKFNVGKSNLLEVLFPKASSARAATFDQPTRHTSNEILSESSLLPPAQPEVPFPSLPLVSSLPGTTASPIRLPFGNGRGELIDMPGLARGNLDDYVLADHRLDLVMTKRPRVEQHTIRAGQSLLLGGGLIRITPLLDPDDRSTTMLAYPFVPIDAHVTSTEKAMGMQAQQRETTVKSILAPGAGASMASAGVMELDTDVTKSHAGAVLRASDKLTISKLPFQIYSTDLVIEGVGWIELVCQVRRGGRKRPATFSAGAGTTVKPLTEPVACPGGLPAFEIFTPEGKHVVKRRPMGAWMLWQEGNPKVKRMNTAVRARRPA